MTYNMCIKIILHQIERSEVMVFNTGAALLDAIVLAVVSKEQQGTYGYKITQDVRQALESIGVNLISGAQASSKRWVYGGV